MSVFLLNSIGAPKIRAMEIINELEPDQEKYICRIFANGDMETCIH